MTPGPSLAGVRLLIAEHVVGLPVLRALPLCTCSPAQRLGVLSARFPNRINLPQYGCRVGPRVDLFEACSAFTRVTACTLTLPPIRDTLHRRLQPLRYLHSCSGCFRLKLSPGGAFTHWEAPPFHGARQKQYFRPEPEGGKASLAI